MTTPYSDQSYGVPAELPRGMAISSLVLGIVGVVLVCLGVGAVFGVIAVVLGIVALRRVRRGTAGGKGLAIGGIVTGAIATLLGVAAILYFAFVWSTFGECVFERDPVAQQECVDQQLQSRFATP